MLETTEGQDVKQCDRDAASAYLGGPVDEAQPEEAELVQAFARHRLNADTALRPLAALSAEIAADPEHAWGWHCNIAVPIMDATGVSHELANEAAAHLMQHLFGYDITTDERYVYDKSDAQSYAEFRIAADEAEDAEIAALNESQSHV